MVSNLQSRWAVRGATFVLWALAAAGATYWAFKLAAPRASAAVPAVPAPAAPPADPAAIARLLGSTPQTLVAAPVVSTASRFSLVGVVADRSRRGTALIVVDGQPAKPFRVGSPVDDGFWLQSVEGRRAVLAASAAGPAVLTLELPPLNR